MIRRYIVPADRLDDDNAGDAYIHLCDDCARERYPEGLSGEFAGLLYFSVTADVPSDASCRECNTSVFDELPI